MNEKDRKKLIAIIGINFAIIGFIGSIPFMVNESLIGTIIAGVVALIGMTMAVYGFSD